VTSALPFSPGQRVEVILIAENEESERLTHRFAQLLKETQAIHATSPLTAEEIQAEIEACCALASEADFLITGD